MNQLSLRISIVLGLLSVALLCHAQQSAFVSLLKEGDIVFQQLDGGELGKAIDKVTEGYGGHDYNHCGLVVSVNDSLRIVEAIGNSVHLTALSAFEARSSVQNLLIGRLRRAYRQLIAPAEKAAMEYIGTPYDDYFVMNNGKMYCSELIYEAFKTANRGKPFFQLKPMTFKDPDTGHFFPPWVTYYNNLSFEIPEGKPGINPGLLSRSSKIVVIFVPSTAHQ